MAAQQRVLGLDVSTYQNNISQTTWNNLHTNDNRQFVFIRSSRGGTTGEDHRQGGYTSGNNTFYSQSERYDDPYYCQNIARATAAGMFAGSYHFSRPDVIATTTNSDGTTVGVANTGTDEADHFIQMAGPWMRPGYLIPMHDLEAGDGVRTDNEMAQFCIDFSTRIYQVMGIRPGIYINGNYAAFILQTSSTSLQTQLAQPAAASPSVVSPAYPYLWSARWPNQADPNSIDTTNGQPKDTYTAIYGPWDDYGVTHPWKFWQSASTAHLASYSTTANLDVDVANGGIDFLKDQLVPAVWMKDTSGDWSTLTNWNSGITPVAPVQGTGQLARVGTLVLPTPRLPGATGTGVTSGQNDTVILERPSANIAVNLTSGSYNIRKLYLRETLNISGGSLTMNYVPSADSTTNGAQISAPLNLSGSGSLSVHTMQVDTNAAITFSGGTLMFNTISLMPHSTVPAKIFFSGDVSLNPLSNAMARIIRGAGSGTSGSIDLSGGNRTWTIGVGTNDVDVSVEVPISNGALTKAGLGTLRLGTNNSFAAGTTISAGTLLVANTTGSGTGTGAVTVNGGTLAGTGIISGAVAVNNGGTIAPGTVAALGTLTLNSTPMLGGNSFFRVNRNGGSPLSDRLTRSGGALNYTGTLTVSNIGAAFVGGEVFTLFSATGYSGSFANTNLPSLNAGLNWYLGSLVTNGTIKVNRSPIANTISLTNNFPDVLQIPISTLLGSSSDADGDAISLVNTNIVSTNGVTLGFSSGNFTYSNLVNAADQCSYSISDGHGGFANGVVQIVPTEKGQFARTPSVAPGALTLHLSGRPGSTYYVERATNLPPVWMTISTNIAPADGMFDFMDDFHDATEMPLEAFYRLRW